MKLFALLFSLLLLDAVADSCLAEKKKFCANLPEGPGQLVKCLSDYEKDLSPACLKEVREFRKTALKNNPCFEDKTYFCENIPNDPGKLDLCLLKNESRLSATCGADFRNRKGQIIVKNECAQDIVNLCYPEIVAPEGSVTRCLIRNRGKLTKFCQTNVDLRVTKMKNENPCFEEMDKHCPTQVKFADIQDCMEKKLSVLSPNCKRIVQSELSKKNANPCYADLIRHCKPNLPPDEQNRCLQVNQNQLSNACHQFRARETSRVEKMVELCEADRVKLCPKAPFANGLVVKCLRENKDKLSQGCKGLL